MNLNDFNRYAEDFTEKKDYGYRPSFHPELLKTSPIISTLARDAIASRQAQMMNINRQNQLANLRLQQSRELTDLQQQVYPTLGEFLNGSK